MAEGGRRVSNRNGNHFTRRKAGFLRVIFVEPAEVEALLAEDGSTYEPVIWGKRAVPGAVCVNLGAAAPAQVRELLEEAWRMRAPKRAVAALEAADNRSRR